MDPTAPSDSRGDGHTDGVLLWEGVASADRLHQASRGFVVPGRMATPTAQKRVKSWDPAPMVLPVSQARVQSPWQSQMSRGRVERQRYASPSPSRPQLYSVGGAASINVNPAGYTTPLIGGGPHSLMAPAGSRSPQASHFNRHALVNPPQPERGRPRAEVPCPVEVLRSNAVPGQSSAAQTPGHPMNVAGGSVVMQHPHLAGPLSHSSPARQRSNQALAAAQRQAVPAGGFPMMQNAFGQGSSSHGGFMSSPPAVPSTPPMEVGPQTPICPNPSSISAPAGAQSPSMMPVPVPRSGNQQGAVTARTDVSDCSRGTMVPVAVAPMYDTRLRALESEVRRLGGASEESQRDKDKEGMEGELRKAQAQLSELTCENEQLSLELKRGAEACADQQCTMEARIAQLERSEQELRKTLQAKVSQDDAREHEIGRLASVADTARRLEGEKRQLEVELDRRCQERQHLCRELDQQQQQSGSEAQELRSRVAVMESEAAEAQLAENRAEEKCRAVEKETENWRRKIEHNAQHYDQEKQVLRKTIEDQRRALASLEGQLRLPSIRPGDIFKSLEEVGDRSFENAELKDRLVCKECDIELAQNKIRELLQENHELRGTVRCIDAGRYSGASRPRNGGC